MADVQISQKALILPFNIKKQILIQDRSNIKKRINMKWGYFGGTIEEGETPLLAVIRETDEELGVKLNPDEIEFLGIFEDQPFDDLIIIRHVYLWKMNIDISEIKLGEGKDMKFFYVSELANLMDMRADKDIAIEATKIINV